jgi:hypothetical protein
LESVVAWLRRELKLEVNAGKSGVGPSEGGSLLGFRLYGDGRTGVAPKAVERLKAKVRELWDARPSRTGRQMREPWQQSIRGWWNYFAHADWRREVEDLSGWIRRHMRKCRWQRWHSPAGRINALRKLGVRGRSLGMGHSKRGAWAMAAAAPVQWALKNAQLRRMGLGLPWEDVAAAGHR